MYDHERDPDDSDSDYAQYEFERDQMSDASEEDFSTWAEWYDSLEGAPENEGPMNYQQRAGQALADVKAVDTTHEIWFRIGQAVVFALLAIAEEIRLAREKMQ